MMLYVLCWSLGMILLNLATASHHFTPEYDYRNGEIVGEVGSGESEFGEPAAIVYDIMSKKMSKLERRIQRLENSQCDCNQFYTASEVEQLTRETRSDILLLVSDRLSTATTLVENRTNEAIQRAIESINLVTDINVTRPGNSSQQGEGSVTQPTRSGERQRATATTPAISSQVFGDCNQVAGMGGVSGVYSLRIGGLLLNAYCDIDDITGEAWLVIQRQSVGNVDFYRNWTDYKEGFGNSSLYGDFWLGLESIHHITNSINHMLRVEVQDDQGTTAYADYNKFKLSDEDYKLSYSEYYGTAGDSLISANGKPFSTYDNDHDNSILYNCAKLHKGAFWYDKCGSANLNGVLEMSEEDRNYRWQSVTWYSWYSDLRPMKSVQMKIRPVEY